MALSWRSGGIDGRPTDAYIASNVGDSFARASSASTLTRRIGCPAGTTDSGDIRHTIEDCLVSVPRISRLDHDPISLSIPRLPFFRSLLVDAGITACAWQRGDDAT